MRQDGSLKLTETMTEHRVRSPKRGSWLRKLLFAFGALFALAIVAYFILTSSAFLKGVILPKVGAGVNSDVTVADASISPFSQVTLRDLKVTPKGAETLLTIGEVRLRYSLFSLLGGKIVVDELAVDSPAVNLVQNADGTSNLDPILKATKSAPSSSTPAPAAAAKPLVLDIRSVTIKNASVKQITKLKPAGQQVVEIANGTLTLANLKNGQTGKLDLGADVRFDTAAPTNASLAAKINGNFTVNLGPDALPQTVNGAVKFLVTQAGGALVDLNAFSAAFECDMTPTQIKQIALKFQKGAADLGQVRLSGPLDLARQEGKLQLEVFGLDRQVLNLAGRSQGLDFGATTFSSTNEVELTAGGKSIALSGQFLGRSVSVSQQGLTTPALDFVAAYSVAVDQAQQSAWLHRFTVDATSAQKPLLRGVLAKPMKFDWKPGANAVEESALTLTLSGLDLRDYRAFLGTNIVGGVINGTLDVQAKAAGKQLLIALNADGAELAALAGTNSVSGLGFTLASSISLNNFQKLQINRTDFKLRHGTVEIASASATGNADVQSQELVLALNATASLPGLLGLAPPGGDAPLTSGTLSFDASVKQENLTLPNSKTNTFARSVEGKLNLANLSGTAGGSRFDRYDVAIAFDLGLKNNLSLVRKASGAIKQAGLAAGSFESQAEYDAATGAAKFTFKLAGLNENALRPFLAAALGDKSLGSVAINSEFSGGYDPATESTIKGELSLTNLVLKDPTGRVPATPLEARFKLDVGLRQQVAELRDCTMTLTPTARGKNAVQLKGSVDFSKTNAIAGALKLVAESLDATTYCDVFSGGKAAAASPVAPARPPAASGPDREPDALALPFRNFTLEANVGHFYLRQVDVSNFQTTLKLDGGQVTLKPFQLTLNGAPVTAAADVNLGVPGYTYDVSFSAQAVPLAPLVDSAAPEYKGACGGTATAEGQLKGAGITGANLQKNLAGKFYAGSTNMNLVPTRFGSPLVQSVVGTVAELPSFLAKLLGNNSLAALVPGVGNQLKKLSDGAAEWDAAIDRSPINAMELKGAVSGGRLQLEQASLQSPALIASGTGELTLAPALSNSVVRLAPQIQVSRALAQKVAILFPDGVPTNAPYVALPAYFSIEGPMFKPAKVLNSKVLGDLALTYLRGAAGKSGNSLLQQASGLLGGARGGAASGGTGTNAPAAKSGAGGSALTGALDSLLGGGTAPAVSNSPAATRTNPPAAQPQGLSPLLDLFNKPKKK